MATLAQPAAESAVRPWTLRLPSAVRVSEDQLFELCRLNRDLRIERTARGDLEIMPPAGGETGARGAEITAQLHRWAKEDGTGVAFDSSTGFVLPNRAVRSPDASWVRRSRLAGLTRRERERFLPLCPDFVVEIRSPTDALATLQDKLQEYVANGVQLGLLIDPQERTVHLYGPGVPPEVRQDPEAVSAGAVLPGFSLQLAAIWELRW